MAGIAFGSAAKRLHRSRTHDEKNKRLSDPHGRKPPLNASTASEVVEKLLDIHHAPSKPRWRKEQERLLARHLHKKQMQFLNEASGAVEMDPAAEGMMLAWKKLFASPAALKQKGEAFWMPCHKTQPYALLIATTA
jgi:hypothetical protein